MNQRIHDKVHKFSQVYLELDAIQFALEAMLGKLNPKEELTTVLAPGLELLKLCLDYNAMSDPMLLVSRVRKGPLMKYQFQSEVIEVMVYVTKFGKKIS